MKVVEFSGIRVQLTAAEQAMVDMLLNMLAAARCGEISALAVVVNYGRRALVQQAIAVETYDPIKAKVFGSFVIALGTEIKKGGM